MALSTAWHMAQAIPNLNIVLLEARQVGYGVSGRNGGMVMPQTALDTLEIAVNEETHKWTFGLTVDSLKSLKKRLIAPMRHTQPCCPWQPSLTRGSDL